MKNLRRTLAVVFVGLAIASVAAACGGGPCADLEKKKGECKGDKDTCEKGIDAMVKAGNADACKKMVDTMSSAK